MPEQMPLMNRLPGAWAEAKLLNPIPAATAVNSLRLNMCMAELLIETNGSDIYSKLLPCKNFLPVDRLAAENGSERSGGANDDINDWFFTRPDAFVKGLDVSGRVFLGAFSQHDRLGVSRPGVIGSSLQIHSPLGAVYECMLTAEWKATGMKENTLTYQSEHSEIAVELIPLTREEIFPGSVLSIEFASSDDRFISIQRQGALPKVSVHISTLQQCEIPYTLPLPDFRQGIAFLKEIFFEKSGSHYKQMLQTIAETPWRAS